MGLEFIIALTEHRYLGNILSPYLIKKSGAFYSVLSLVKLHAIHSFDYKFSDEEINLIKIIDSYSDENLARKFSRTKSVSEFFNKLNTDYFQKNVTPFIESKIVCVFNLLSNSSIRLFQKEAKYSNLYEEDIIKNTNSEASVVFKFERFQAETKYSLSVFRKNEEMRLLHKSIRIITNKPCSFIWRNQLFLFERLKASKLIPFYSKEFVSIPATIEEKYFKTFVLNTIRNEKVIPSGFQIIEESIHPKAELSLEPNLKFEPVLVLRFYYGHELFLPQSIIKTAVRFSSENGQYIFRKTKRNSNWESQILNDLQLLGLTDLNGFYLPEGLDNLENENALFVLVNFINANKSKFLEKGIEISQNKYEKIFFTGPQDIKFEVGFKKDWFDVYGYVYFGEFKIPFLKLKKYLLNGIREFELPNGEIAILPKEWFARYKHLMPFAHANGDSLRLKKHHYLLLKNTLQKPGKEFFEKFENDNYVPLKSIVKPKTLQAQLRPYQAEGFNWLYQMYNNSLGGCLADDMGLGKTLQTLALLLKLKRLRRTNITVAPQFSEVQPGLFDVPEITDVQPSSLIVMPTSLIHNWENEIKKFAPALNVFKYIGAKRKKSVSLKAITTYYDIILTTYGTIRNDIEKMDGLEFFYLILDESQNIKNAGSKTYKSVIKLNAQHRLVLTGTPIENSLSDLWAQLNFLNSGLLGNLAYFKQNFITPIEKHNDEEAQEKLQILIRPFVLRRKKKDVAKDLPPLMEQVTYCTMDTEQKEKYEKEKSIIRNAILENIEKEGVKKSSFVLLQGLTKLRQLANHPVLIDKDSQFTSGKFSEIVRALENLMAEDHKVLIFSSFVKHLELLKVKIESSGWKYSMLTGATKNREQVIKNFQEDPNNKIFLISLKAGGVGLNLTEADYVFIIDPWWNPAAENQAINRAHRIGQNKHVFVYRFITENSIEEKIQMLKEHKNALSDKFINSNNPFKTITSEEILGLFN